MKRILLFLVTNLAVMLVLSLVMRLLGIDEYIAAQGGSAWGLLVFAAVFGFGGAIISLLMSKWSAKRMMGVEVDNVVGLSFFIGSALAGASGLIFGLYYNYAKVDMGFSAGLRAFTAAVLGGIGNLRGALLGGLLLGLIENYGSALFGGQWKDVVAFGVLVLVLMVRPTGILGESLGRARA